MIALDLCQPHYQSLFITYLKFIVNNAKDVNQYVMLLGLKITNCITNVKNVIKDLQSQ